MLRHIYDRLEVTGDLTAVFDPKAADGLEKAVDYLRRVHYPVAPTTPPLPPPRPRNAATPPQAGGELNPVTPRQTRRGAMVWLMAVTKVKVGSYRWPVNSLLTYEQVAGKTNDEIWKMFDNYTDKHIEAVVRAKVSYPIY